MTPNPSASEVETRVGQARLEEGLKHLEKTMSEGFKRIEEAMSNRDTEATGIAARVNELEKRVDKIYWVWGAAVFIGTPVMMAFWKFALGRFGL
jgi:hypothetical protein